MKRSLVVFLFLLVPALINLSCQSDDLAPRKDVYVYGGDWTDGPNQNAFYKNNVRTTITEVDVDNDWGWKQRLNVWQGKVRIVAGEANPVLWIDGITQTFPEGFIAQFVDFDQEDVYVAGRIGDKWVICKNNQKVLEFSRGLYVMENFDYSNGEYYTTGYINGGGERAAHYTRGDVFHDLSDTKRSGGNVIRVVGSDIYVGGMLENRPVIWKNGTPTFLGERNGEVYDLWLVKNTMYASGYAIASGVTTAAYWIDGVETILQELGNSILYSIFVTKDKDFYVLGETNVGGGEWRSLVIKDGKLDPSFDPENKFWGASIFIDER